jgi:hypothetical protein
VNDSQGTRSHAENSTLGFSAPYQDSELSGELSEWHKKQTEGTNVPGSATHGAHYERDSLRTPDRYPSGIQGSQLEQQNSIAQEHGKQTASNNVTQDKPKTTQEDIKMTDAIKPDDIAPAPNKPAKPAISMPASIGKSKPRRRLSKIPEQKWIILCGSSGDVTRLDGSEISCQPHIIVFHRFSSLLLLFIHHCFGVLYNSYDRKLFNPNF